MSFYYFLKHKHNEIFIIHNMLHYFIFSTDEIFIEIFFYKKNENILIKLNLILFINEM